MRQESHSPRAGRVRSRRRPARPARAARPRWSAKLDILPQGSELGGQSRSRVGGHRAQGLTNPHHVLEYARRSDNGIAVRIDDSAALPRVTHAEHYISIGGEVLEQGGVLRRVRQVSMIEHRSWKPARRWRRPDKGVGQETDSVPQRVGRLPKQLERRGRNGADLGLREVGPAGMGGHVTRRIPAPHVQAAGDGRLWCVLRASDRVGDLEIDRAHGKRTTGNRPVAAVRVIVVRIVGHRGSWRSEGIASSELRATMIAQPASTSVTGSQIRRSPALGVMALTTTPRKA